MPDTIAFDLDTFNESTKTFWDVAYQQGYDTGYRAGSARVAKDYTKIMLGVAEMYIETALHPDNPDLHGDITRIRRILSQTPMLVPQVYQALTLTDRIRHVEGLRLALAVVRDGLKALTS